MTGDRHTYVYSVTVSIQWDVVYFLCVYTGWVQYHDGRSKLISTTKEV